eukprot:7959792-Pyramimonas_sp.AAC.1
MYDYLTAIHDDAVHQKRTTIITGNFNAQVLGKHPNNADDDANHSTSRRPIVGTHGMGDCNTRGTWSRA